MRRFLTASALLVAVGCGSSNDSAPPLHEMSTSYDFTISPSQAPPHAREDIQYTITVLDLKTRQPIENGEGRLFASDSVRDHTWDGMTYGPQIGTYHAKLNFVQSGFWAMAIQFRRDSLHPLERIDWYQDVLAGRDTIP